MNGKQKQTLYIVLFAILGFFIFQILHTIALSIYGKLLLENWYLWSFGYPWSVLTPLLDTVKIIFDVSGIVLGFLGGTYFWKKLYDASGHLRGKQLV